MTTLGSFAALALLASPAASTSPDDGFELLALIGELEAAVPSLLQGSLTPGAGIALIENGEVVWEQGFGYSNVETKTPVTTDTVFNIGSISKTIAAWGVMKLVEEGKLELDAPVADRLEGWEIPDSKYDANGVTIRRLLSHTAGLSLHGYPGFWPDQEIPTTIESLNGDTNGSGSVELFTEPGTTWRYSGGGYTIAQLLVEQTTGKSFAEHMRGIFPKLGMQPAGYDWPDELRAVTSTCYDELGRVTPNPRFAAQAAASLKTTAGSLARFGALIFEGPNGEPAGRGFLSPETVEEMLTAQPASGGIYGIGYQVESNVPGHVVHGHGGANRGWHATLKLLRPQRAGLVVLTNGSNGREFYRQVGNIWLRHRVGVDSEPYGSASLATRLLAVYNDKGVFEMLGYLDYLREAEPQLTGSTEDQLNRVGHAVLASGEVDDAILVFLRNAEFHPYAWNTHDSLGYAYMKRDGEGDVERAIACYEEAVRLNAGNEDGKAYLEELRAR